MYEVNFMTTEWNTWTLASNIAGAAFKQRADERAADDNVADLMHAIRREWRAMVKDVRFGLHGGVDTPERRRAYAERRIAGFRAALAPLVHRPEIRETDRKLLYVLTKLDAYDF